MEPHYSKPDLERLLVLLPKKPISPQEIGRVIDQFEYLDDWKTDYKIRSVHGSLQGRKLTCVDAAVLSYGLLELYFPRVKRQILAIHRRDQSGEECGHVVTLYWDQNGKVGGFSKSSFPGFGHRPPEFQDEQAVAESFAQAYVKMGFVPLYYGVMSLEEAAGALDWRYDPGQINDLSERLVERYQFSFDVTASG